MRGRSLFYRYCLLPLDAWRTGSLASLTWFSEFERTQYLDAGQLRQVQQERLTALLKHAFLNCPWYTEQFQSRGIELDDLGSREIVRQLPQLSKRDIQLHRNRMVARQWPSDDLIENRTGGSTGTPISFFMSRDRHHSRTAAAWRHDRWAGYEPGDKLALLWGAGRDLPPRNLVQRIKDRILAPQIVLNTACVTEAGLRDFLRQVKKFRPRIMLAYAKAAVLLARYVRAAGISPYRFHSIITSAEVLEPDEKRLLEETFGCEVFNRYGCREVSLIASECRQHNGLHVMAEGLLVEVVRDGSAVTAGTPGALLITDLLNYAMPLIRYRIDDVGQWADGECACGRALPRLESVQGRVTDFLVGSDDRLVSGAALTIAMVALRPTLGQLQIVQSEKGQVHFRVAPVNGTLSASDSNFLQNEAMEYLGRPLTLSIECVSGIEPEASGKFLFSRSTATMPF